MATTTNYGWDTPDDTDLVKDGAAAIRTLGSSVDTTTKALNPSTTLGDIEYRSATANTNTRLGIGSTGNVLTVAAGVPTWSAPAGFDPNFELINAGGTALTGANSITVSGISGKKALFIMLTGCSSASASSIFTMRFNGDTSNNYESEGIQIVGASPSVASPLSTGATDAMELATQGNAANNVVEARILMWGTNTTGIKPVSITSSAGASGTNRSVVYQARYSGTSAISSVNVRSSIGNFDAGTIFVYGA
jgi:hypothetical protein